MKNRLLTMAGALALMAVFGKFYAVPLIAQVRAALIKNVDEKGRVPYMQQAFLNCSTSNNLCDISFATPVPASKRLVIENVNANIFSPNGINNVSISTHPVQGTMTYVLPAHVTSNATLFDVNERILTYFEAGDAPFFRVALGTGGTSAAINVVVAGYLVDLTQ